MKTGRPIGLPVEVVVIVATVLICMAVVWSRVSS
jgi:hypothetical protein